MEYWDAGETPNLSFRLSILDCLRGLEKAINLGWYNHSTFSYKEYERMYKLDNGDMNWIIPGKILAFSSPSDAGLDSGLPAKFFLDIFRKMKIKAIIRLNEPMYDEDVFKNEGINVHNLEFTDGTFPNEVKVLILILYRTLLNALSVL